MQKKTLREIVSSALNGELSKRHYWFAGAAILPFLGAMTAVAVAPGDERPAVIEVQEVRQTLKLNPQISDKVDKTRYWREERVLRGDTVSRLLIRLGVDAAEANRFIHDAPVSRDVFKLQAGATLSVEIDDSGELFGLRFLNDDENGEQLLVSIEKKEGQWQASAEAPETDTLETVRSVEVRTSVSGALAQAGVPAEIRAQLGEIFSDQLDMGKLKKGDRINLVYETIFYKGTVIATGNLLGVEIHTGGQIHEAFYFAHDSETGAYYDGNGKPLKKGFSHQPISNSRVSSGYGMRFHPILRQLRMHKGIDYAASSGTPIVAPSDGSVRLMETQNGYGNVVILRHSDKLSTLYAHMSRFETRLKPGSKVKAGDVIGYVGSTGRSTGPHLHMEVHIDGQAVDPSTTALPVPGLSAAQHLAFRQQSVKLVAKLQLIRDIPVTVAQRD